MFLDARNLPNGETLNYEVCVVGAGAAGITVARRLSGRPYRVCLIESGGLDFDDATQALAAAVNAGRDYKDLPHSRLRMFGGSTNHWGGQCLPIDPEVFAARSWVPYSGWPIGHDVLAPYYRDAHAVIGLGPFDYDPQRTAGSLGLPLLPLDERAVHTTIARYRARNFGRAFRDDLQGSVNVDVLMHANVTGVRKAADGRDIDRVDVATLSGSRFGVRARVYVLAAGGIENARLLLLSNDVEANGLGNGYGLVGRFFMEHVWYPSGTIVLRQPTPYDLYEAEWEVADDVAVRAHVALPADVLQREGLPQFRATLQPIDDHRSQDFSWSGWYLGRHLGALEAPEYPVYHLSNVLNDLRGAVRQMSGATDWPMAYRLANYIEQTPNPDSRVFLSGERDALDQNRAAVDWRLSPLDKECIRRAQELIAMEVGRAGLGRMRIEIENDEAVLLEGASGGSHHMGTTRMHENPRLGVTDRDCRVHGIANLYVAGSSVFPCAGYPSPTLTIVALSLRLADHLHATLAG